MNADFYIEKLKEMVRDNPDSKLFLTLAEELRKRGESGEAMAVIKAGIDKNPSFVSARLTLGRWNLKDGLLEEAEKEFKHVLELSPDDKFAARYLADIRAQTGSDRVRRTTERLNKLLESIKKAFAPDSSGRLTAGEN
jgi:tetratricopeptide (TPR) repeat protein